MKAGDAGYGLPFPHQCTRWRLNRRVIHRPFRATGSRGFKDDLDVASFTLIELRKGVRRLIKGEPVTDDLAGLGSAGDDHVPKFAVPALVIIAAHRDANILVEQLGPWDHKLPVLEIQALGGGWDRSSLPERPECCGKLASGAGSK